MKLYLNSASARLSSEIGPRESKASTHPHFVGPRSDEERLVQDWQDCSKGQACRLEREVVDKRKKRVPSLTHWTP